MRFMLCLRLIMRKTQGTTLDEKKDKTLIGPDQNQYLRNMVMQKLIRQDAKKQGIKLDTNGSRNTLPILKRVKIPMKRRLQKIPGGNKVYRSRAAPISGDPAVKQPTG
jgi:hypothetical protein